MIFNKTVLGMIHLAGGNPVKQAIEEIEIYEEEGIDGIIIENYHNSPNCVIETLDKLKEIDTKMKIGVNILPNEFKKSFEIANKFNLDFIQLDYVSGKYFAGYHIVEINEEEYITTRNLYPNIKVLGGVWPKYYTPVNDSDLIEDLNKSLKRCDAVVVTGSGTGKETPLTKIRSFRTSIGNFPLIIGAGLTPDNVIEQMSYADGCIVGSAFKPFSNTNAMIDRRLVRRFMDEIRKIR